MEVLDCTIRDGGYVNDWKFSDEQVNECYKSCSSANIEYMEIGFRNRKTPLNLKKYGSTFFCDEDFVNRVADDKGPKLVVMVTINDFDINDFVECKDSKIKLVRILMAYHGGKNGDDSILDIKQLNDGISQINQLIQKGYNVSFNLGRIDKVSNNQLFEICKLLSTTGIQYFTMADTYGSIDLNDIEILIPYVVSLFRDTFKNNSIKIGFHAHDNCANGTSKALYSLKYGVSCIDGCIMGFGRGSGNAKTELLCMDMNKNYNKKYNFIQLLDYADRHISNYKECKHNQSYNIIYALTGYLGCHVSYAIDIIEKQPKVDVIEIYNVLNKLKSEDKHIFYDENVFKK
jgi:4-hydroxy 2-oxovalerate aldolase